MASTSTALSLHSKPLRLAIVGAGPAGFYAAARLFGLPGSDKLRIDMYEELPVPFGLVRYGVAPDHPEVKNCIHKFEEVASDPRFSFFGNVQIGGPARAPSASASASAPTSSTFTSVHPSHKPTSHALSVPLSYLRQFYNGILFTYGASHDRSLGPSARNDDSETLENVLSARSFVHWYNGHPHSPFHRGETTLDLSNLHNASIIGQGNVALDCARILLSGGKDGEAVSKLKGTDIPESVLATLRESVIESVDIVGRRGPLQFAGTTKEVRELVTLDEAGVSFHLTPVDKRLVNGALAELKRFEAQGGKMENARMKKRLLGLMQKPASSESAKAKKWSLSFCQSPVALLGNGGSGIGPIRSVVYELNDLQPASTSTLPSSDLVDPSLMLARGTGQTVEKSTDLLLKSVGYRSVGIEGLPFDERKGVVRNEGGRVQDVDGKELPGLYVSGWLARGPNGVIATTMYDAFETAELIAADLGAEASSAGHSISSSVPDLPNLLDAGFGGQKIVSWDEWRAIDAEERKKGSKLGKEREKFTRVEDMLAVLG